MMIDSFLSNRDFQVTVNGHASETHMLQYGVPQGAVLSPMLYSIYTSDTPLSADHETALFADDIAKYKSSRRVTAITNGLKKAAKATHRYATRWKIKINGAKTQAMFITRRRKKQIPRGRLRIFDADIEWSKKLKYLGVIIDSKLTFKPHVDYVIDRANKAIRVLYPLLCRRSKLDITNKLLIYKLAIRPIITYASPALKGIAATHIKKMQIAQNKALKMIHNRAWYTSTAELHRISNVPTIADYIDKLTEKFESKLNDSLVNL
jgi:hypothetical protein